MLCMEERNMFQLALVLQQRAQLLILRAAPEEGKLLAVFQVVQDAAAELLGNGRHISAV